MNARALIFTSYVNAYAIFQGLRRLGVESETSDQKPLLPIPVAKNRSSADWLFFTEEASLCKALRGELIGKFHPEEFPIEILDDKYALVEWLAAKRDLTQGLRQWSMGDPHDVHYPCLLKAKHSWLDGKKLPRGWICQSADDLHGAIDKLAEQQLDSNCFFLQEWLGGHRLCRVISVCGYHDCANSSRNLIAVVERIASHTEGLSCSAAVETVADEWNLIGRTAAILDALQFVGPYELEYLVVEDRPLVLELNPRFWMQHAIFIAKGNGLIKRYLGLDQPEDWNCNRVDKMVWVDGLHLIYCLLTFRWKFVGLYWERKYFGKKEVMVWPSLLVACFAWVRVAWSYLPRIASKVAAALGSGQ